MNREATNPESAAAPLVDLPPLTTVKVLDATICYREASGPAGAPVVLLLHGILATSGLNWMYAFAPLSRHFRVGPVFMETVMRLVRLQFCLMRAP